MKKLPYREIRIPIEVFKTKVIIIISKDTSRAAANVRKWFKGEFEEWDPYSADGKTISKDGFHPVMWLREFPSSSYQLACLHHEVNHAVSRILDRLHVPLNHSTEEVYTYLGEYIFHEVLKRKK